MATPMPAAATMSSFRCPYGCPASGGADAKRMTTSPITFEPASVNEWTASEAMASEPDQAAYTALAPATARFKNSTWMRTRLTAGPCPLDELIPPSRLAMVSDDDRARRMTHDPLGHTAEEKPPE